MRRPRFYFLEPSKVGSQHITLIAGYLDALVASEAISGSREIHFCSSASTRAALPRDLSARVRFASVPVMDPEKRRLALKTLVEFAVVARYLVALRRGDVLFVSCLLPTTLLLVEWLNRLLRRRGVYVSLHGEVEGLFEESTQRMQSFGYWILKWMRGRKPHGPTRLVVIDDFIKERLLRDFPAHLAADDLFVVHHPVLPVAVPAAPGGAPASACFIGYRTRFKGFPHFERYAREIPGRRFVAIGGGKAEDLTAGATVAFEGEQGYFRAIGQCDLAVFPYVSGYTASLSAAALDALATGVHIVATDRACFRGLAEYLGPDFVTLCESPESAGSALRDPSLWERSKDRLARLQKLEHSKFSLAAVRQAFERLVAAAPQPA
jgi:glycosyltransferase involved in cell wall biosynthesis